MARGKQIQVGDRVAYSAAWLRSIGCCTGELPQARGTVTSLQAIGKQHLATVQWDQPDLPAKVLACNLALVGPNTKFCSC